MLSKNLRGHAPGDPAVTFGPWLPLLPAICQGKCLSTSLLGACYVSGGVLDALHLFQFYPCKTTVLLNSVIL